jgi:formate/nitrite transporter FocA (FNT family)
MLKNIIHIAILCIVIGSASIPVSFTVSSSPIIVWLGNALGSLISALVVIYIGDHITNRRFKQKISKHRVGKKVVTVFDEGDSNKHVLKARVLINKHGLRVFSFICPIFPGVLISTATVYLLDLDKRMYKRWMVAGVFFASGAYVFAYWFTFVRVH